jgi:hypothetical protein
VGNLVASATVGTLWTAVSPTAGLMAAAAAMLVATAILTASARAASA